MKKYILILAITLIGSVGLSAQDALPEVKTLTISGFKGLNTLDGEMSIDPDYARVADNVDFESRTIKRRMGYDSIGLIAGQDSIVSMTSYNMGDGKRYLVFVTDSTGVDYGNIYVTAQGSHALAALTRIATKWGITSKTNFTTFQDRLYISNGTQKSMIWDGRSLSYYPPNAPGEPIIVPLK